MDSDNWGPIYDGLQNFQVARALETIGYTYDHIGSWWAPTHDDPTADRNYVYGRGEFSQTLMQTTIWPVMSGTVGIGDPDDPERTQYERVGYQFDSLDEIAADPDPTFTFAHFTLPHPPYVFDAEGNYVEASDWSLGSDAAYVEQLKYTNTAMLQMVDRLLAGPDETDPIVVIQSDEGPHPVRLDADEDAFEWPDATDAELGGKFRILDAAVPAGRGCRRPPRVVHAGQHVPDRVRPLLRRRSGAAARPVVGLPGLHAPVPVHGDHRPAGDTADLSRSGVSSPTASSTHRST